jgi:hypothetical protein
MSEDKSLKDKFIINTEDLELSEEEEKSEEEEEKVITPESKAKKEYYDKLKEERKQQRDLQSQAKHKLQEDLTNDVLKILKKGKVESKRVLTNLLVVGGVKDWNFRFNFAENAVQPEIDELGGVLKKLRFQEKIHFSLENGSHCYYINNKKLIKQKNADIDFDFKKYNIPEGVNEVFIVFKMPCKGISAQHLLASCFPAADFDGFKLMPGRKYETDHSFVIFENRLDGFFDNDKLILRCRTTETDVDKTIYAIVQIGRKIITENLKLSWRFSEILKINNNRDSFLPFVPILRANEKGAFFHTKYHNVFRLFYDFVEKIDKKIIYGKNAIIVNQLSDEEFKISDYYDFCKDSFDNQTKSFISLAIRKDWIINPTKAVNYISDPEDKELGLLVKEYLQDINTDKIIQDRLVEQMQKNEFFKEITSNLLMTLLGLSFLSENEVFRWIVLGAFVAINVYFFYKRRNRLAKKQL